MIFISLVGGALLCARMRGWLAFAGRLSGWANRAGYRNGIGRWVLLLSIACHPLAFLLIFRMRSAPKYDDMRAQEGRYVDWLIQTNSSTARSSSPSTSSPTVGVSLGECDTLVDGSAA